MKEKLPHSTTSLVLGIFSIVTCWCFGLPGVIMSIIAFLQGKKALAIHNENPDYYEGIGNAKAGKITAIIGLLLSLYFIFSLYNMVNMLGGWDEFLELAKDPDLLRERLEELQNR